MVESYVLGSPLTYKIKLCRSNVVFPRLDALHILDVSAHFDAELNGCN